MSRGLILVAIAASVLSGCAGVASVYEIKPTAAPLESIRSRVSQIVQCVGDYHAMTPPHSINQQIFIILRKYGEDGGYTAIYGQELKGVVCVYVSDWPPGGGPGITRRVRSEALSQLKGEFGELNVIVRRSERFDNSK